MSVGFIYRMQESTTTNILFELFSEPCQSTEASQIESAHEKLFIVVSCRYKSLVYFLFAAEVGMEVPLYNAAMLCEENQVRRHLIALFVIRAVFN